MSKQIAVRLPDDIVSFIDQLVGEGKAASRADMVSRALDRERRRVIAERDIELLARAAGKADGLEGLAEHASQTPMDDID